MMETDQGQCPACELSGVTAEHARERFPTYMTAVAALPPARTPDEPAAECWTCRGLRAAGHDPKALIAADIRPDGLPLHVAHDTVVRSFIAHGVLNLDPVGSWSVVTHYAIGLRTAEAVRRILADEHGFGVEFEFSGTDLVRVRVDPRVCPADVGADEREMLIDQIVRRVECETREALDCDEDPNINNAVRDAGEQEELFGWRQTVHFLRRLAAPADQITAP